MSRIVRVILSLLLACSADAKELDPTMTVRYVARGVNATALALAAGPNAALPSVTASFSMVDGRVPAFLIQRPPLVPGSVVDFSQCLWLVQQWPEDPYDPHAVLFHDYFEDRLPLAAGVKLERLVTESDGIVVASIELAPTVVHFRVYGKSHDDIQLKVQSVIRGPFEAGKRILTCLPLNRANARWYGHGLAARPYLFDQSRRFIVFISRSGAKYENQEAMRAPAYQPGPIHQPKWHVVENEESIVEHTKSNAFRTESMVRRTTRRSRRGAP